MPLRAKADFHTTRWSVVIAAGEGGNGEALEGLLRAYWFPLYAFARRAGQSIHDAQDLTQSFVAHLLARDMISSAEREKGRFRSYLLGAFKNFMGNDYRRQQAQKRGGEATILSIDEERGEERYQLELTDENTPSDQFDRSWALALLSRVMGLLRSEFENAGRTSLFAALQPRLAGATGTATYAMIAEELGLSESAVTVSLHRMRKRYGELLRDEIAETVAAPEDVEPELQHLLAVVSR